MTITKLAETPDEPRVVPAVLTTHLFHQALVDAGVIRDGERIRRIVLDARAGQPVMLHIERFGDSRLLDVVQSLDGIEVRESHR